MGRTVRSPSTCLKTPQYFKEGRLRPFFANNVDIPFARARRLKPCPRKATVRSGKQTKLTKRALNELSLQLKLADKFRKTIDNNTKRVRSITTLTSSQSKHIAIPETLRYLLAHLLCQHHFLSCHRTELVLLMVRRHSSRRCRNPAAQ